MMKNSQKIGIITFHRAINYGAVLQAYALQKTLTALGAECETIDYRSPRIERSRRVITLQSIRSLRDLLATLIMIPAKVASVSKFDSFIKRHIKLSKAVHSNEELRSIEMNKYVAGSDQVWNYNCTDFDKSFFLDFANAEQKFSYAASFGFAKIPAVMVDEYREVLSSFRRISVRETQGVEIIDKLLGRQVSMVLDPVLLLEPSDWRDMASKFPTKKQYIMLYILKFTWSILKYAEKLAEETGLPLIWVRAYPGVRVRHCHKRYSVGPEEFVSLLSGATHVVTNSFHGVAFSVLFNKAFHLELLREDPSSNANVGSRLVNIVDLFGLRGRVIDSDQGIDSLAHIDYEAINAKVRMEREESIRFLRSVVDADCADGEHIE